MTFCEIKWLELQNYLADSLNSSSQASLQGACAVAQLRSVAPVMHSTDEEASNFNHEINLLVINNILGHQEQELFVIYSLQGLFHETHTCDVFTSDL